MYADITAKVSINADQGVSRRSRASVSGADGDAAWDADAPLMAAPEHTKNNLSTLNGCYVPCLLNILGAVLFLRIGFSVGQLGLVGTLGIFLFSEGIAYLTITSFSAIVTNGRMKGGGAYYMICQNLGSAFGGSSGLLFWFTYCINVTFNTVAFTETFMPTFFPQYQGHWYEVMCSTITLFVLFLVAYAGASVFAKVNIFIFCGLMVSLAVGISSIFVAAPRDGMGLPGQMLNESDGSTCAMPCTGADQCSDWHAVGQYYNGTGHDSVNCVAGCCEYTGHFYPWAWEAACPPPALEGCTYGLKTMLYPTPVVSDQCGYEVCSLLDVFAIVFPAVCGMMEGANLSGDLKDPAWSIPWGTLAAVSTCLVFYVCLIIGQAGSMDLPGLHYNMRVMQYACLGEHAQKVGQYFVVLGVATACLSTSLGSMFGSSRILQAISRDNLLPAGPGLNRFFALGTVKGDEPRRAVVLTYVIAQSAIFIGGLDAVAPILTNFFLLTYSLTNLATFLLETSGLVNFRPTFKFYCWQSALFGSVLNMVVMFYINVLYGCATVAIVGCVFAYLSLFGPDTDFGDISQAIFFQHARRSLLGLQGMALKQNRKYWRPSILLVSPTLSPQPLLLGFLDDVKKGGVLVIGHAVLGAAVDGSSADTLATARASREALLRSVIQSGVKAFAHVVHGTSMRLTCQNLVLSAGIPGAMEPDLVALPLPSNVKPEQRAAFGPLQRAELADMVADTLSCDKPVLLMAHFDPPDVSAKTRGGGSELGSPARLASMAGGLVVPPQDAKHGASWRFRASRTRSLLTLPKLAANNPWEEAFASPSMRNAPDVRIDIWLLPGCEPDAPPAAAGDDDSELRARPLLALVVQLGYILSLTRWRKYHRNAARLRIIQVVLGAPSTDSEARCETLKQALAKACGEGRVPNIEVDAVELDPQSSGEGRPLLKRVRSLIMQGIGGEAQTAAMILAVPMASDSSAAADAWLTGGDGPGGAEYVGALQDLAYGGPAMPPTMLVSSACKSPVITTDI